jgi:hypothetical protein
LFNLGRAGDRFGWIPLDENPTNIAPPIDEKILIELKKKEFSKIFHLQS